MRIKKFFKPIVLFCFAVVFACDMLSFSASAKVDGLELTELPQDQYEGILSRLDLQIIDEPSEKKGFRSFDVNSSGEYVMGFDRGFSESFDYVLAYSGDNTFLFGFSLNVDGMFCVVWDERGISICTAKGDLAITIDRNGNCLNINRIEDSVENNDYFREELSANTRHVNGATYTAEHWCYNSESVHWGSYPRLVKTTADGERSVLYEHYRGTWELFVTAGIIVVAYVVTMAIFLPKAVRATEYKNKSIEKQ